MRLRALVLSLLMLPGLLGACSSREPLRGLVDGVRLPNDLISASGGRKAYAPGGPEFEFSTFTVADSVRSGRTAIEWFCDELVTRPGSFDPQLRGARMKAECANPSHDNDLSMIYLGKARTKVLLLVSGYEGIDNLLKVEARYIESFDDDSKWQ